MCGQAPLSPYPKFPCFYGGGYSQLVRRATTFAPRVDLPARSRWLARWQLPRAFVDLRCASRGIGRPAPSSRPCISRDEGPPLSAHTERRSRPIVEAAASPPWMSNKLSNPIPLRSSDMPAPMATWQLFSLADSPNQCGMPILRTCPLPESRSKSRPQSPANFAGDMRAFHAEYDQVNVTRLRPIPGTCSWSI